MNKIEIKIIAGFGVLGLVFSLFIGMISFVDFFHIIIRAIIFGLIFSGIAYLSLFVLKKYISEIYEILIFQDNSSPNRVDSTDGGEVIDNKEVRLDYTIDNDISNDISNDIDEEEPSQETEKEEDLKEFDLSKNVNAVNMGDHILVGDKKIPNDPEVMAGAIRTMLAKDETKRE